MCSGTEIKTKDYTNSAKTPSTLKVSTESGSGSYLKVKLEMILNFLFPV